jgi:hypothetical protein
MLPTGWGLTKKSKWQYHKNPEAGSAGHQAAEVSDPAAVEEDLTKAVSGAGLLPAKKQNIVSIILFVFRKYD